MKFKTDFLKGLKYSLNGRKIIYTSVFAAISYVFLLMISMPGQSLQALNFGIQYLPATLKLITYANIGTGVFTLSVIYSIFMGVIMTNLAASIQMQNNGLRSLSSVLPGVAAAGCGGCGAGLLAVLGFAGALSFLPFGGAELYLAGIGLLMYSISDIGDPTVCDV